MGCVQSKKNKSVDDDFRTDRKKNTTAILPVFKIDCPPTSPDRTSDNTIEPAVTMPRPATKTPFTAEDGTRDAKVLGKYRLKNLIGEGTFSRVWMVESRLTRQPYAMKMTKGVEGRYIYQSELAILSRVRHPHVVQLIETFETGSDKFYMVLELATGGDLFDRTLQQPSGRFAEPSALRILREVLDGLSHLHGLGITHRDLKPDNLLFYHPGEDSRIMISDFSVAHMRGSDGNRFMRTGCGTAEYLAPEVLGRQAYTSAVDLWALGVVAYVVLSGSFPFDDEEEGGGGGRVGDQGVAPIKLYRLIMKGVYSFGGEAWESVSDSAKDFIRRLLVVDPKMRLNAVQALGHPWLKRRTSRRADGGSGNSSGESAHDQLARCASSSSHSGSTVSSSGSSSSSSSRLPPTHELDQLRQCVLGHLSPTVSAVQ